MSELNMTTDGEVSDRTTAVAGSHTGEIDQSAAEVAEDGSSDTPAEEDNAPPEKVLL